MCNPTDPMNCDCDPYMLDDFKLDTILAVEKQRTEALIGAYVAAWTKAQELAGQEVPGTTTYDAEEKKTRAEWHLENLLFLMRG